MFRFALSITLLVILLSAAGLRAQPADASILRGESPQTRKRLAEAEQKIINGKAAEAVEDLQRILDEAGDDLITLDNRQHRSARSVTHGILTTLPADVLKSYQNRIEEPARKLLDAAKRDRDPKPLWQLLDRYFVSRPTEEGLLLLGDLLFERGDFRLAEDTWKRLLPDPEDNSRYPNAKPDMAALRARIVLAVQSQGEPVRAQIEFAAFIKLHPDAKGTLAGKTGLYVDVLREWLAKPQAGAAAANRSWPTYSGEPSRSGSLNGPVPVRWPTRPTKTFALPPGAFPVKTAPARPPFGHPVIHDGWAYASDGLRVLAFELATGSQKVVYPPGNFIAVRGANDPPSCSTLTVAHGRIYARLGLPVIRAGAANRPEPTSIVCLDPHANSRVLWRLKPPIVEGRAPAVWEGTPLVANDRLWAAFSRTEGGRIVYAVACYDPADSDDEPERPAWVAEVCESPLPPGADQIRGRLELLTLAGRHVVFNSNAGAVVALDAETGHRSWAFQYPRATRRLAEANRSWESSPAVVSGGRVFVAPADCERVYGLDAESGRELWESGPVEGAQILGVTHNRVILSTTGPVKGLRGLSVVNGSYRRPDGWLQTTGLGYGQGFVSDGVIFWPSREGLYFLDPDTGNPSVAPRHGPGLFGNLAYADGWLVVVGDTEVRAYRTDAAPYVKPPDLRNPFTSLMDQGKFLDAARGDFPKSLRVQAAARVKDEITDLRDEWLLTDDGELISYGRLLDRRGGKPDPERSAPGSPWSAADRKPLDAPNLTADSEVAATVKLPIGSVPLRAIRGAKPPHQLLVAAPSELLAIQIGDGTRKSFSLPGSCTHAAELPDGFMLAGPLAVAVYGAGREPVWVFRVPDLDPLPQAELTSFNLAGEWLFARLGDRHLIALDLKTHCVAWVLGTHGSLRFEPLMFETMPGFTPQFFVSERLLAVQLTDGRRWFVQAATGGVKSDVPTAAVPWMSPPVELEDNRIAFPDGPGLIRFCTGAKSKQSYRAEGESSFAGEPPQLRRFGEMLFVSIRRNVGVELLRLDPSTGKPEWREPAFLEAGALDFAAADADPQRLLVPAEESLSAFSLDDGQLVWRVKLPPGRWIVRAGRTVAIAYPAEAIADEPLDSAWSRLRDSFLRSPQPWRLPCLAAALYDCWTERTVPVILFDMETGKRLKTLTIPTRGPCITATFEGDSAVIATGDRVCWVK